jgi:hypothetical protein
LRHTLPLAALVHNFRSVLACGNLFCAPHEFIRSCRNWQGLHQINYCATGNPLELFRRILPEPAAILPELIFSVHLVNLFGYHLKKERNRINYLVREKESEPYPTAES